MERLDRWNPEAGFFHTASKHVTFLDPLESTKREAERAVTWPMPSPVKRYAAAELTRLERPTVSTQLERVLVARRTWRRFGAGTIPLQTVAQILGLTAGIQQWVNLAGIGQVALKTAPSGGARHPVELYMLACGIDGLKPGLYHYAPDEHALELLRSDVGPERLARYFPQSKWYTSCCAAIFFTAVYERDLWRYAYSRAYRAPFIEAGHLCQTFCLLATAYDLAPFCLMALSDATIEGDIGIDGISESVLYAAGIGVRPPEMERAPAPPGFKTPEIRPNPFFVP